MHNRLATWVFVWLVLICVGSARAAQLTLLRVVYSSLSARGDAPSALEGQAVNGHRGFRVVSHAAETQRQGKGNEVFFMSSRS